MNQFDFQAFFQQLTSTESLIFIAFCLGAFLLGIFLGLAIRGGKVRRLKKELKKKDQEVKDLELKINEQTEQINIQEADLKKSAYDLNQIRIAADRYEQENKELNKRISPLQAQNEDLQRKLEENGPETSITNVAQVNALQQQINYLKTRNEQLQQEVESLKASPTDPNNSARARVLEQQVAYLKTQNAELMERLAQQSDEIAIDPDHTPDLLPQDRLAAFEARLAQLENENATLKASVSNLGSNRSATTYPVPDSGGSTEEPNPDLLINPKTDLFRTDRALLMDQSRDDLSRIDGIGPFIEKKLNDANVYTFEQIASWSDADIKIITQRIQYFEGRIEKDNWIGQAKILVDAPPLEPNNEETTTLDSNNNDDLKVIEGIGPKIESILKSAGITSLEQLAKSDPADLQLILEQNEAHYHMHDSTTWPAQARLAANGDWDVLEDYQDELIGGREPNDVD